MVCIRVVIKDPMVLDCHKFRKSRLFSGFWLLLFCCRSKNPNPYTFES